MINIIKRILKIICLVILGVCLDIIFTLINPYSLTNPRIIAVIIGGLIKLFLFSIIIILSRWEWQKVRVNKYTDNWLKILLLSVCSLIFYWIIHAVLINLLGINIASVISIVLAFFLVVYSSKYVWLSNKKLLVK